jgi:hypothetical protein
VKRRPIKVEQEGDEEDNTLPTILESMEKARGEGVYDEGELGEKNRELKTKRRNLPIIVPKAEEEKDSDKEKDCNEHSKVAHNNRAMTSLAAGSPHLTKTSIKIFELYCLISHTYESRMNGNQAVRLSNTSFTFSAN